MPDRSDCGCTWERRPGFGDVIVAQCLQHAHATARGLARAARLDALKAQLRAAFPGERLLVRIVTRKRGRAWELTAYAQDGFPIRVTHSDEGIAWARLREQTDRRRR